MSPRAVSRVTSLTGLEAQRTRLRLHGADRAPVRRERELDQLRLCRIGQPQQLVDLGKRGLVPAQRGGLRAFPGPGLEIGRDLRRRGGERGQPQAPAPQVKGLKVGFQGTDRVR